MSNNDYMHPRPPAEDELNQVVEADTSGDSLSNVTTRTIPLEGGTAIVEHVDNRAEVTIRLGDRIICAVALSTGEAEQIGWALARPEGYTITDAFNIHEQLYPTESAAR